MSQSAALRDRNVQRIRALIINRYLNDKEKTATDKNVQFYPVLPLTAVSSIPKAIWQRINIAGWVLIQAHIS